MKLQNSLFRAIQFTILLSLLTGPALSVSSAAPIGLIVTPQPPAPWVENPKTITSVTFSVLNNTPTDLILDYAAEIISWPGEIDDQVWNTGAVTFSTYILAGMTGTYTFGLYNPNGDPTDCCDPGVNPITFYIEMSTMNTTPTQQTLTVAGALPHYGTTVFPTNGSSVGSGPNAGTLADLNACFAGANPPNTNPPCNALLTDPFLYSGNGSVTYFGTPDPSVTQATVLDTPEPATFWGVGMVMLTIFRLGRRITQGGLV